MTAPFCADRWACPDIGSIEISHSLSTGETANNDARTGTGGNDPLSGLGGNDYLRGLGGDDQARQWLGLVETRAQVDPGVQRQEGAERHVVRLQAGQEDGDDRERVRGLGSGGLPVETELARSRRAASCRCQRGRAAQLARGTYS